jgi:hypothetical protein
MLTIFCLHFGTERIHCFPEFKDHTIGSGMHESQPVCLDRSVSNTSNPGKDEEVL